MCVDIGRPLALEGGVGPRIGGWELKYINTYEIEESLGCPVLECETCLVDYPVTTEHAQLPRSLLLLLHN